MTVEKGKKREEKEIEPVRAQVTTNLKQRSSHARGRAEILQRIAFIT